MTTINDYLELFEGAFLIKALQKYSGSELKKRRSSPQIVLLNTALVNAKRDSFHSAHDTEWKGRLFKCAVGAELCRCYESHVLAGGWRRGRFSCKNSTRDCGN